MAPPIVWICLFGYLAIGLFVMGLLHDDPGTDAWIIFVWPFWALILLIYGAVSVPYWLGKKLSDVLKNYKNRGNE